MSPLQMKVSASLSFLRCATADLLGKDFLAAGGFEVADLGL